VLEAWEDWKEDALDDADYSKVENNFDILAFSNEWGFKTTKQFVNMSSLLSIAYKENIITLNQKEKIEIKRNKTDKLLSKSKINLEKELKKVSVETVEEMKASIQEKYDRQTSE
ncbi:hypothetical protein, partial [Lentibacillus saliphilus]|uniref:hypothetical protein n=1 Tax=Lentibacillus saliphilus TaxID=2737028 RepID=UPI001C30F266